MANRRPLAERFWEKVDIRGLYDCWEWKACRDALGYGRVGRGGRTGGTERAYRLAYELSFGPIPEGLYVRHPICNNPPCCNPSHLFLGTPVDNSADILFHGRYKNAPPLIPDPNRERWEPIRTMEVVCQNCGLISSVSIGPANDGRHRYCSRACYRLDRPRRTYERFWEKVDQSGDCWNWTAARDEGGYGVFGSGLGRKMEHAHRFVWRMIYGKIPAGLVVRHYVCSNRLCVRSNHLRIGTKRENSEDMVRQGRQAKGKNTTWHLYPDALPKGEAHPNSKLTESQVREMRALYAAGGETYQTLGPRFGVSPAIAGRIVIRKMWKHVE